jgi:hypothetical protein
MKVEVLYFDGCPNHILAVERAREVLGEEGISATISQVNVSDASIARHVSFLGSPSVRVNGVDVEPAARSAREYGMMCRTYMVNGHREELPSREMIRQAILEAQSGGENGGAGQRPAKESRSASLFAAGSILAAIPGW